MQRKLDAERRTDLRHQSYGQYGVSAKIKEAFMNADILNLQQ